MRLTCLPSIIHVFLFKQISCLQSVVCEYSVIFTGCPASQKSQIFDSQVGESEMVGNRPSRSKKGRKNNKYQSDLPTIRFCRNLLCRRAIPSKLRQTGLTIRASTSRSRFSPLSSACFALWFNTVLSHTFFFSIFIFLRYSSLN